MLRSGLELDSDAMLESRNEDKSAGQNLVLYRFTYNAWYCVIMNAPASRLEVDLSTC
jgi:hypothetical protein